MTAKIVRAVLEAQQQCKYKAHLLLTGGQGSRSDHEALLAQERDQTRLSVIDHIVSNHSEDEVLRNVPLNSAILKPGASFILDATYEDGLICLLFDGLQKVDGASTLGDFHYVPLLFDSGRQVHVEQKVLLELYGLLLARVREPCRPWGCSGMGRRPGRPGYAWERIWRRPRKSSRNSRGCSVPKPGRGWS
jgi:hypothetical protein